MRIAALIIASGLALVLPVAYADPLKVSEILNSIEGGWGLPPSAGADRYSCEKNPAKIWLEEGRTIYKSKQVNEDRIYISKVGVPANENVVEPTYILISYTNFKQPGLYGRQVVWSLSMPSRNTFVWREVPFGLPVPALVRCAGDEVG